MIPSVEQQAYAERRDRRIQRSRQAREHERCNERGVAHVVDRIQYSIDGVFAVQRHDDDRRCGRDKQCGDNRNRRPAIRRLPADHVAERHAGQENRDQRAPRVNRSAEERDERAPDEHLERHRDEARHERRDVQHQRQTARLVHANAGNLHRHSFADVTLNACTTPSSSCDELSRVIVTKIVR